MVAEPGKPRRGGKQYHGQREEHCRMLAAVRPMQTASITAPAPKRMMPGANEILAKVRLVETNIKKLVDNNS